MSAALLATAAEGAPLLQISPKLDVRYDSNVARTSQELADLRGIHRRDWRATPSLNVQIEKLLGNQTLFLTGDVGYDFYARNKRLNRGRIALDGGARLQISSCTGTLSGDLAIRQSDLAELIAAASSKNTEYVRTIGLDARCGDAIGFAPFGGASRTWVSNSSDRLAFSDYKMNQFKGGLAYARPVLGELSVIVQAKDTDYPNRDPSLLLSDHFHVFSIGGRYSRAIGSRLQGSVSLSRATADSGSGFPKFKGLTSEVDLTFTPTDRLRLQGKWVRDVQPVGQGFGDFGVDSRLNLDGDYGMSPRFSLGAGGGLIRRRIEGEGFTQLQLQRERRAFGYARLSYKRSIRTTVDLDVRHERRRATPSSFNYNDTSVGLVFRTAF